MLIRIINRHEWIIIKKEFSGVAPYEFKNNIENSYLITTITVSIPSLINIWIYC